MSRELDGKTILVTGGTGTFGQKFAEIVLREHAPKAVRILSRGEFLQSEMARRFNDNRLRFLIGDVRDSVRLHRAFAGVDIVVHAAALKQVPTVEYNPIEAVHVNITGAINVIDAALDCGVPQVMAIGSDKEVYPVNLYGATKMVAEKLFIQSNVYSGGKGTQFSCIRYGNVIGSRGSVIPLFREQQQTGEITITDGEMTRFWLTIEQGVRFVIRSIGEMRGREIFVPKAPSMKMCDVAEAMAPGTKQRCIGLRPGEKTHEVLIATEEGKRTLEFDDHFVILPEMSFTAEGNTPDAYPGSAPFGDNRSYTSDNNTWWLSVDEMRGMADEG